MNLVSGQGCCHFWRLSKPRLRPQGLGRPCEDRRACGMLVLPAAGCSLMTASAFHPDQNVKRKEWFQQTEDCGHGRWLERDSYKLDYFLGKNQEKKRGEKKKNKLSRPILPGWEKETRLKERGLTDKQSGECHVALLSGQSGWRSEPLYHTCLFR